MKIVATWMSATVLGALSCVVPGSANAIPTPVSGVVVGGPGERTAMNSELSESFVSPQDPNLFGFGRVDRINDLAGSAFCASGACELTYVFRGYVPIAFDAEGPENSVVFAGGVVDFFLDGTPDSSFQSGTGFNDSDSGNPWLSLIGLEQTETEGPNAGLTGSLFSEAANVLDPSRISGSGDGLLTVSGGEASSYFGFGTIMSFLSDFRPAPAGYVLPLAGPAQLEIVARGEALEVPEPGTLLMIGMGLIAFARMRSGRNV